MLKYLLVGFLAFSNLVMAEDIRTAITYTIQFDSDANGEPIMLANGKISNLSIDKKVRECLEPYRLFVSTHKTGKYRAIMITGATVSNVEVPHCVKTEYEDRPAIVPASYRKVPL